MARHKRSHPHGSPNRPRMWGKHAVAAALDNPIRKVMRAWATHDAAALMQFPKQVPVTFADVADLGRLVPHDAPHQGGVIEVEPLEDISLGDILSSAPERPTLVLIGPELAQCRAPALGGGVRAPESSPRKPITPEKRELDKARRARSSGCRGRGSSISPGRWTRSARLDFGGSGWLAKRRWS